MDVLHLQEVCATPAAAMQLLRSLMDLHTALDQQQQQQEAGAAPPFGPGIVKAHYTGGNWRHDMVNARLTVQQLHQAVHACLAQVVLAAQVALVTAGKEVEQLEAALCSGPAVMSHANTWAPSVVVSSTSRSSISWTAGVSCPTAGGQAAGPAVAAAVEALQQVKAWRICLAAAVCPRRLQQGSSAAFTALDAAARVGDVAAGLKTAMAAAGECEGDMAWAAGVSLSSMGANVKDVTDSSSCPTRPCPAISTGCPLHYACSWCTCMQISPISGS